MGRLLVGAIPSITISRPTVAQARHKLGYQPGGVQAKLRPWLIPVLDALHDGLGAAQVDRLVTNGEIEFLGFEHMRGRTVRGVFLLDEAQNCTLADLEMFCTRIGDGGQLVICGDPDQSDVDGSGLNNLAAMVSRFSLNAAVIRFDENDVVRSDIASEWVRAFAAMRKKGPLGLVV